MAQSKHQKPRLKVMRGNKDRLADEFTRLILSERQDDIRRALAMLAKAMRRADLKSIKHAR